MTDKIEQALSEGMEEALGVRDMAQKLAPRGAYNAPTLASLVQGQTVEMKLQQIERLVSEIRSMSAQVKGMLG